MSVCNVRMSSSEYALPAGSLRGCQRQQNNSTLRLLVGITAEWWCCFDVGLASLPLAGVTYRSAQPLALLRCICPPFRCGAVHSDVYMPCSCMGEYGNCWHLIILPLPAVLCIAAAAAAVGASLGCIEPQSCSAGQLPLTGPVVTHTSHGPFRKGSDSTA
jgi:hypothetical protein